MADTPISSDPTLTDAQISGSDLVPVVDVSEAAASDKNKNTTFTYLVAYFNTNLNFEPVDATIVRTTDAAWNATEWDSAYSHSISAHAPSDADNTAANETSHADVVQDGDFASTGLMKRGATAGSYSIVTDNSANWNTAFGWGDHTGLYAPSSHVGGNIHIDWTVTGVEVIHADRYTSGAFSADAQTQVTPTTAIVLDEATGDEVALDLSYTVNKATSGASTGIYLDATLTSAPGTDYLVRLQAGGFDRFYVRDTGTAYFSNTVTVSSLSLSSSSLYRTNNSGTLSLFGGGYGNGGNVVLYGGDHSQADDIEFRTDTTVVGHYDANLTKWDFQANDIVTTGKVGIDTATNTYSLNVAAQDGQYNPGIAIYGDGVASGWARLDLYPRNSGNTAYDTGGYLASVGAITYLRTAATSGSIRLQADDSGASVLTSVGGSTRSTVSTTKMQNTVPLLIGEAAAATTDVDGYGQLWVKNETPNELWFTDDAGTDVQVSMTTGTFTPTLRDNTNSDSESQTYSAQNGEYWLIGKLCYLHIEITMTSLGTLTTTEQARIGNLPFTSATGPAKGLYCVYMDNVNLTAASVPSARVPQSQSYAILERTGSSTTDTNVLTVAQVSADGTLVLQGFYEIA